MKKISIFIGALLLLVGCSKEANKPGSNNSNSQAETSTVEAKNELLTENEKAFLKFSIEDELKILPTLSSGDNESLLLTSYFPVYSADQITNDYDKNEIKANNLYKNKYFFVNGKISGIEAGIDDKPVVRLETKANYGFNSPMLRFNKIDHENVAELSKGSKATFFCVGNSEIGGSPILDDCLFLETFKTGTVNQALEFEDQNISGNDKQWEKAIYTYVSSALFIGQVSNDFQKCKVEDADCINKLFESMSKEEKAKYQELIKAKFPKASKSLEN